uniref:Uncharacterized protein n=1 Tax=Aegilops tauschii subsp. strangulata TaxID=200361 RepID=A0A453NFZ2_AEGTS
MGVNRQSTMIRLKSLLISQNPLIISTISSLISKLSRILGGLISVRRKNQWSRRSRGHRRDRTWRTAYLARKNTPETNATHVNAHEASELGVVSTIEDHRTARDSNIARCSRQFFFSRDPKSAESGRERRLGAGSGTGSRRKPARMAAGGGIRCGLITSGRRRKRQVTTGSGSTAWSRAGGGGIRCGRPQTAAGDDGIGEHSLDTIGRRGTAAQPGDRSTQRRRRRQVTARSGAGLGNASWR